jgi:hypothetical protein
MAVWCMHIAGCITKATNTHSEYVYILLFHCNGGCKHAPQCYFILVFTLPVLFVTDMESVHCAVRTASLRMIKFRPWRVKRGLVSVSVIQGYAATITESSFWTLRDSSVALSWRDECLMRNFSFVFRLLKISVSHSSPPVIAKDKCTLYITQLSLNIYKSGGKTFHVSYLDVKRWSSTFLIDNFIPYCEVLAFIGQQEDWVFKPFWTWKRNGHCNPNRNQTPDAFQSVSSF